MSQFSNIIARAYNRPLLMDPERATFLFSYLNQRVGFGGIKTSEGVELDSQGCKTHAESFSPSRVRGSYQVSGGIAIIPIDGTLVHKSGNVDSYSGTRGYDGIQAMLSDALDNQSVKGILLDVDSGGGEVSGVQALADSIVAAKTVKPVWGHANEMAASAAYWLISAADKVFLANTARVGSIGVLTAHMDASKAYADAGYKVTLIYSGAHKVDGNPYEALSPEIKDRIQADIDSVRNLFAGTVAKNRSKTTDEILATEAAMYSGQDAVDVGLADKVQSFAATLTEMQAFVTTARNTGLNNGGHSMSEHEKPVTTAGTEYAEAIVQAKAEATTAERSRCASILSLPEAKGREATVAHLITAGNSAEQAQSILASIPVGNSMLAGMSVGAGVQNDATSESTPTHRVDAGFDKLISTAQGAKK